jgi:oxygen-independent coproporphyrinogen-3 oxidase
VSFGVYIHIPHCLQRCHYCDFATISIGDKVAPSAYADLIINEINLRHTNIPYRHISTIYFGGGTPSLMPASDLERILKKLKNTGFSLDKNLEATIEINPGTINAETLSRYIDLGLNRFSLGVQTFKNPQLKALGREHSAEITLKTLELLSRSCVNYSADILFAIANQNLNDLSEDLLQLLEYKPPHISCYILTLPEKHKLNQNRAPDEEQAKMYTYISDRLSSHGYLHYEISNFAKPGFESKHNILYWSNQPYWGLGMSAHSYLPGAGPFGVRSWNAPTVKLYQDQLHHPLPKSQTETLKQYEAKTDFCHMHLRRSSGINLKNLPAAFGESFGKDLLNRAQKAQNKGLLQIIDDCLILTPEGRVLANQALLDFTFLPIED